MNCHLNTKYTTECGPKSIFFWQLYFLQTMGLFQTFLRINKCLFRYWFFLFSSASVCLVLTLINSTFCTLTLLMWQFLEDRFYCFNNFHICSKDTVLKSSFPQGLFSYSLINVTIYQAMGWNWINPFQVLWSDISAIYDLRIFTAMEFVHA